jgi:hypothetical protein
MSGGASPPWMREALQELASAIPGARYRVLEGQTHAVDPRALARAVEELVRVNGCERAVPFANGESAYRASEAERNAPRWSLR